MASSDSQQAVSEQPTLLSPMGSALAVVDVNHVHGRRGSQNGDNERAKKRPRDAAHMAAAARGARARKKARTQALEAELAHAQEHAAVLALGRDAAQLRRGALWMQPT